MALLTFYRCGNVFWQHFGSILASFEQYMWNVLVVCEQGIMIKHTSFVIFSWHLIIQHKSSCPNIGDTDLEDDCHAHKRTTIPSKTWMNEWKAYINTIEDVPEEMEVVRWWGVSTYILSAMLHSSLSYVVVWLPLPFQTIFNAALKLYENLKKKTTLPHIHCSGLPVASVQPSCYHPNHSSRKGSGIQSSSQSWQELASDEIVEPNHKHPLCISCHSWTSIIFAGIGVFPWQYLVYSFPERFWHWGFLADQGHFSKSRQVQCPQKCFKCFGCFDCSTCISLTRVFLRMYIGSLESPWSWLSVNII